LTHVDRRLLISESTGAGQRRATGAIMAVPKRKHSNARTGSRRAHNAIRPKQLEYCPKCSMAIPSHTVCPKCGHYGGRTIVEPEE